MSATWHSDVPPPIPQIDALGWILVVVRGLPLAIIVFGGLMISLMLRLVERPIFGGARPVTPHITVFVCRAVLRIIGLNRVLVGQPMQEPGAVVANHASWLDILVLNAQKRVYFVSKSEVARWPGIGWLARATGTVFIERARTKAAEQSKVLQERLVAGHRVLFFPEGTSSDGLRVLPFKTSLFAAFAAPDVKDSIAIQPVSVTYEAPAGRDARFYGWWGDMDLGPHLLSVLAQRTQGRVRLVYGPALKVDAFADRKALAAACEAQIRASRAASCINV